MSVIDQFISDTPNQWVSMRVENSSSYIAAVGVHHSSLKRTGKGINLHLYPYFGGQDVAPHDMIFKFNFK